MDKAGKAQILERARRDAERMIVPVITKKKKLAEPKVGQAPDWAKDDDEEEEDEVKEEAVVQFSTTRDRRLERLADVPINKEEALRRRRERQTEVIEEEPLPPRPVVPVMEEKNEEDEEESFDEEAEKRRQLRLHKIKLSEIAETQEKVEDAHEEGSGPKDEKESSEYESYYSEDEEDVGWGVPVIQPVFVGKQVFYYSLEQERETLAERDALDQEAAALEAARLAREVQRKDESKALLKEQIKTQFEVEQKDAMAPAAKIEDEEEDEAVAYEQWKQRELARIRRDKKEKEEYLADIAETERRRKMTDAEIEKEDANTKLAPKQKGQMKFLQRYYHKDGGQYDVTNMEKYVQNYLQPTLEDHFDKTALPKVLQVKNFGKAGRTKYTHLVDQDTTFNEAYSQKYYHEAGITPLPPVDWKLKKGMGGVGEVGGLRKRK